MSAPRRLPRALAPLARRDYALLAAALTLSLFGGGVWLVAMVGAVFAIDGTPADLSLIAAGNAGGMIVAVLFGGVLADRLPQQRILVVVEIARTAIVAIVIALGLADALEIWHLALASLGLGIAEGMFYPAYSALMPRILDKDKLLAANGLEGMLRPLAHDAAGPALSGLAIAAMSPVAAFALIAVTQLGAIALLLGIRDVPPLERADDDGDAGPRGLAGLFRDLWLGVRYMVRTPWLLWTLLYACVVVLLVMGPLEVLLPFAVRDQTGGGTIEYSIVLAAFGIGAALGSLIVASLRLPRRYLTIMNALWAVGLVPFALTGFVGELWILVVIAAVAGGMMQAASVIWGTILQRRVPRDFLGRVSSLDFFVSLTLMPVSMALAGPVGESIGIATVFLIVGTLPVPIAIIAILAARMHRDELAHPLRDDDARIEPASQEMLGPDAPIHG